MKFQISDQNKPISKKNETISELENEIEEFRNRSLRKTLIFKNIKHQANENSWSETKKFLIDEISKVVTEVSKEEIAKMAHQVQSNSETSGK